MVTISIDQKAAQRLAKKSPRILHKWISRAFKQHGIRYERAMRDRFGVQLVKGRNPGFDRLATRTGALQGSIGSDVSGADLRSLRLRFFIGNSQTRKYANIQEFGGVIFGDPWLAVPLPKALTPTGRPRMGISRPSQVRGKPGWKIFTSKKGNIIIAREIGKKGKLELWWVLKPRVTIKPRLGFRKTVRGNKLVEDRIKRVNAAVKRGLKEVSA